MGAGKRAHRCDSRHPGKECRHDEAGRAHVPTAHEVSISPARLRLRPRSLWLRLASSSVSCPHSVRARLSKAA